MKRQRLIKHLLDAGCRLARQGEHEYWRSADGTHGAGVPRHTEIKTGTARSICRDLHIPPPPEK